MCLVPRTCCTKSATGKTYLQSWVVYCGQSSNHLKSTYGFALFAVLLQVLLTVSQQSKGVPVVHVSILIHLFVHFTVRDPVCEGQGPAHSEESSGYQ